MRWALKLVAMFWPPPGHWWLWLVGPLVVVLVYVLTGRPDRRLAAEIERWRVQRARDARQVKREGSAYRSGREVAVDPDAGPRRVTSLPGPLARVLSATGGGERVAVFELVPKLAYLAFMGADLAQGSNHVTLLAKLDEPGPTLTVRPFLPIMDGAPVPNTGVQFTKDAEFMEHFLVEPSLEGRRGPRTAASLLSNLEPPIDKAKEKAIRKWLSPPLREALLDFPDGWLRVDGNDKAMAFTLYGPADAAKVDELVAAADVVFAEYGAGGGPSLLPDEAGEDASAPAPPPKAKPAGKKGASASQAKA